MNDLGSGKQLVGDISSSSTSSAGAHSEIPLGKSDEASMSNTATNLATWSFANFHKLSVNEFYSQQRQSIRPWTEFFNTSQFKAPANPKAAARRLLSNVEHYQTNYYIVTIILSIYCIISTPSLLFVLVAIGAGCYLVNIKNREGPITVMGRQISIGQQYLAVALLCTPLLLMVGAGSAVFWIIGASIVVTLLHALFHLTPNQEAFGVQMEEV